jgi:carboxypeptidase C (cathepsin A)
MKARRTALILESVALLLCLFQTPRATAQNAASPPKADAKPQEQNPEQATKPGEQSSVTKHVIRINGKTIPYKATASTTLLKDGNGNPTALIFSVAYTRTDVTDLSHRPIAFLYNGGPGSASIWLHIGAFGPRRVITANAAPTAAPPYNVADNAYSLLDKADLVFIDPVGTGYSYGVGKSKDKNFWGVDPDVKSIAQFIATYVTRNNRWNSPKFLIGESYGTFRSAYLADYLQSKDGMYLNGIVLMSTVLDMGTISFNPANDLPYELYLPSYAAAAWYHKTLAEQPADLDAFLDQARQFASTEYTEALMVGSRISETEKADTIKKLEQFTGLSEQYLTGANMRVTLPEFSAQLQRSRGLTTGVLDDRFSGPQSDALTEDAEYDPLQAAITGAFTAAFNRYIHDELKFPQTRNYVVLNYQANRQWDWKHNNGQNYFPGPPEVVTNLVDAMVTNPHLQVQVENGLFDLATPFFATEYTMDHLGLPKSLRGNIHLEYYNAGHMMYLREDSLARLKDNIGAFIDNASK